MDQPTIINKNTDLGFHVHWIDVEIFPAEKYFLVSTKVVLVADHIDLLLRNLDVLLRW
jgi:hypothetical protein